MSTATGKKSGHTPTEKDITDQYDIFNRHVNPIISMPTNPHLTKSDEGIPSATDASQTSPLPIVGYPSLSDFIGSDAVFFIFRRFNALAARNLLYMQDELCELEEKLRIIDEADFHTRTSNSRWGLGSRRHDTNTERRLIMKDIESRLKAYQKALLAQSSILNLEGASPKFTQRLTSWIDGTKPIDEKESHFLDNPQDLLSLLGGERGKDPLEIFIEKKWAEKLLRVKEKRLTDPNAQRDSEDYVRRRLARFIIANTFVIFLMAQVVGLYHIGDNHVLRIIVITVFALMFAAVLAMWTQSSNSDIFTAMAAYLAVLVVFLAGNVVVDKPHW